MKSNEKNPNVPAGRLQSLDALRGFDMLFIMGGAGLIAGLAQWFPCSFTQALADQMNHVDWHGLSHHDTIFPLFLFIAGISFPFSLAKQRANGKSEADIYKKIIKRGLILVLLGCIYNGLLYFNFAEQRYASVLARIGLAWMFGALIFVNTNWKTRAWITAALLIGYWLVAGFVPAPDGGGADGRGGRGRDDGPAGAADSRGSERRCVRSCRGGRARRRGDARCRGSRFYAWETSFTRWLEWKETAPGSDGEWAGRRHVEGVRVRARPSIARGCRYPRRSRPP